MKELAAWSEYCKNLSPAIVEACTLANVSAGPTALARELAKAMPDWHFRHVFERGGWYRLGGVINAEGQPVADQIEPWAEAELAARGDDFAHLADDLADTPLFATRFLGKTHYLIAPLGKDAADFLQVEIEEIQEVRAHRLFSGEHLPGSIEELADPRDVTVTPQPLGLPRYVFRRITHVGAFLERMLVQSHTAAPIHRFVEDWQASSAHLSTALCNHWVMALREHIDRYQQPRFSAKPLSTYAGEGLALDAGPETSGLALSEALAAFDREVGYPMAWFFHLVSGKGVPHAIARTVVEDALTGGFAYLPKRDIEVVRRWLHRPYTV